MGCAPSAELLGDAPFRPPQGGVRQVALIPIVEQYFPTPDCALFRQLYEAYTDPSVRYYVRSNFEGKNGDLSRIPDVANSCARLHEMLLQLTSRGMFATNIDVREAYARGEFYRIRPILCAVVFLYEGANYVPEGSVQLPTHGRGPSVFVKVIGVVGDTSRMLQKVDDPAVEVTSNDTLKMQTLITKSAGDHNMSRVVLLASYIYYHQCCEVIGLPKIPAMAARFTCFKTNIPFLCFLREMRDRTAAVLESPKGSKFYIDEYCLHGAVRQEYVDILMPAFAYYFVSFLNAKSEQRLEKQLAHQMRVCGMAKDPSQDSKNTSTSVLPIGSGNSTNVETKLRPDMNAESDYLDRGKISQVAATAARADAAAEGNNNTAPKVTYIVKGYLTRSATSLSAWSCAPNEVYVTCMDGTVTVVDRRSVDAPDGPTHTPSLGQKDGVEEIPEECGVPTSARTVVETFRVARGDILSFYTPSWLPLADTVATAAEDQHPDNAADLGYVDILDNDSVTSSDANFLRLHTDEDSAVPSPSVPSLVKEDKDNSWPRKGSWRVDDDIYIESVLLSLVRDECKLAREASVDDPRWVHDDEHNCPVHDGSFYIWQFRRGQENFFYGTVPKFANTNRTQGRSSGGALGTRALRNGGVRVNKSAVVVDPHVGHQGGTQPNGSVAKKLDNSSNISANGSNGGAVRQQTNANSVQPPPLQQPQRFGPPVVFPQPGAPSPTSTGAPQQQQKPPSYAASHASLNGMNGVPVTNAFPGSSPMCALQNGSVATTALAAVVPAGPFLYNMPYMLPQKSPQLPTQAPPPPGVLPTTYVTAQPPQQVQQQGNTWVQMGSSAMSASLNRGMGDSLSTANFSVSSNASSAINPPTAVPYMVNAQGQLVPLSNAMVEKSHLNVVRNATSTPPTQMTSNLPTYVVMNGQLCVLHPATSTAPSPSYSVVAPQQQQQQIQPQPFMNNLVYLQR
jgi:hypothetical protein